jgi:hypothetical protein
VEIGRNVVLFNESGGKHGTQVHVAKVWAVMVIELGTKKTRRRRRRGRGGGGLQGSFSR